MTAGANVWRKVEGMMGNERLSRKRIGKVHISCVTPAYMYGFETMALTEEQQEKVQFCENNWIRRIVGVNRADKRRLDELRVDVGVKETVKKKLASSRLKWAGHVENIADEKLTKRGDAQKVELKGGEEDRECDGRTA